MMKFTSFIQPQVMISSDDINHRIIDFIMSR